MKFACKTFNRRNTSSLLLAILAVALVLAATGCGGSGGSSLQTTGTSSVTPNSVQIKIGDAPSDSVLSFELNITKIDLVPQSGSNVTVLSTPAEIELTHLSGTLETLALASVPEGTYTGAAITVSKVEVTYMPAGSSTPVHKEFALNDTVNVTFSPALTVGTGASVVNFDLNLANSLTFDSSGNLTGIAPAFTVTTSAAAPGGDKEGEDNEHGRWDNTVGKVTAVGTDSFTVTLGMSAQSQVFKVDSNTKFSDGLSSLTSVKTGMLVKVDAVTAADGSVFAREVELLEASEGSEVEGMITSTTGTPVTSIDVLVHDETMATPTATSNLGTTVTVEVSNAVFKSPLGGLDDDNNVLSGLASVPVFDSSHIGKGQSVEADLQTAVSATGPNAATKVKLRQQAITGTIGAPASGSNATFSLLLDADSAFAKLTGTTSINVFKLSKSQMMGVTSVQPGSKVKVRGFLFFDGTNYTMVAVKIAKP